MQRKRLPYWIKGALIFGIVFSPTMFAKGALALAFFPVYIVFFAIWESSGFTFLQGIIFRLIGGSYTPPHVSGDLNYIAADAVFHEYMFISTAMTVAVYVVIGALIGLFYSKFKQRHNHGETAL